MTVNGFSGPECREARQLLGVYVVGAIDPAERSIVDDHLGDCADCRDELAGLAGLPAMLSRVPEADVALMASDIAELPQWVEPSPELLNSLLRRVSTRRRSRMWRGVAAVAAAAAIAAGGATAVNQLTRPPSAQLSAGHQARDVVSGMNPATHVAAVVDYARSPWNSTDMRVQVTGIVPGTNCQFWVIKGDGSRMQAGAWTVGNDYGTSSAWYSATAPVKASTVHKFQITAGSKVLLTIPVPSHGS
jgi:hypothetical protein